MVRSILYSRHSYKVEEESKLIEKKAIAQRGVPPIAIAFEVVTPKYSQAFMRLENSLIDNQEAF